MMKGNCRLVTADISRDVSRPILGPIEGTKNGYGDMVIISIERYQRRLS